MIIINFILFINTVTKNTILQKLQLKTEPKLLEVIKQCFLLDLFMLLILQFQTESGSSNTHLNLLS